MYESMARQSMREQPVRWARLKRVFEGRKNKLDALQKQGLQSDPHAYSVAVVKYDRARKAWRAFRGWQ